MNISNSSFVEDQERTFYLYLKGLRKIYDLLSKEECKFEDFKQIFADIEEYQNKLDKEYLDEINIRVNNIVLESIFIRQKNFFVNIQNQNFFFLTEEDRKEELELISQTKNEYVTYNSKIISHSSIYNNSNYNVKRPLNSNLKFMKKFLQFEQYLLWFQDYLVLYESTINVLLRKTKYIPIVWKYYLAIMACSSMKNEYLLRILEEEFLDNGGDINWLIYGLDIIPSKLKKLSNFNNILCHQPWNLKENIINNLIQSMNLSELTEATLVLVEFHKLCLIEELVELKIQKNQSNESSDNSIKTNSSSLKNIDIKKDILDGIDSKEQVEIMKYLEEIEDENNLSNKLNFLSFDTLNHKQISFNSSDSNKNSEQKNDIFMEKIFKKHSYPDLEKIAFQGPNNNIVLTYFVFNWNDSGYYILKNICPSSVDCLNEELTYITSLTSNTNHNQNESEYPLSSIHFQRAINVYVEKLFGYYYEDYNYKYISQLLAGNVKITKYIKKFVCYPKNVIESDFYEINKVFLHEEIVHIILLIANIKSRVQLTYFSKIINEIKKSNE